MGTKEHKAYIKEIRDYKEQLLKSDDEIKAFLKATGIYTKTGKLTSAYSKQPQQAGPLIKR